MKQPDNAGLQQIIDFYEELLRPDPKAPIQLHDFLTRADLYHLGGLLSVEFHAFKSSKSESW